MMECEENTLSSPCWSDTFSENSRGRVNPTWQQFSMNFDLYFNNSNNWFENSRLEFPSLSEVLRPNDQILNSTSESMDCSWFNEFLDKNASSTPSTSTSTPQLTTVNTLNCNSSLCSSSLSSTFPSSTPSQPPSSKCPTPCLHVDSQPPFSNSSIPTANCKTEIPIKTEQSPPSENPDTNSTKGEKTTMSHCFVKSEKMNLALNESMICAVIKKEFEHLKFETSHGTLIKQLSTLLFQSSSTLSLPFTKKSLSRKEFAETVGLLFYRDLISGQYCYSDLIEKYKSLFPEYSHKFTMNFCSKLRTGRILNRVTHLTKRSVKRGDPKMKRIPVKSPTRSYTKMTKELVFSSQTSLFSFHTSN
jgi:hypothetical protein